MKYTTSGSLTVFGEGGNYPTTMVLIYDGIHYDALFESKNGTEVAIHPSSDKRLFFKKNKSISRNLNMFFGNGKLDKKTYYEFGSFAFVSRSMCQEIYV